MRNPRALMLLLILIAPFGAVGALAVELCVEQLIDQLVSVAKPGYGYSDGIDARNFSIQRLRQRCIIRAAGNGTSAIRNAPRNCRTGSRCSAALDPTTFGQTCSENHAA